MKVTEIFQVLGIEETKEEALIKRAYREKLAETNPEDNPEGFKRLRAAYEEACAYARETEDTKEEEDTTPSGQWVKKVEVLYGSLDTRCDEALWKALFEEDIFLSLEEEENCRMKLLRFLMEHFRLPTAVWKLLDEKLNIAEDMAGLKESFPGDFVNYIVNRCKEGEDIDFAKFEGAPDADYDLFIQYSNNCWEAIGNDQLEQAAEFINNADGLDIYHPIMELNRAWLMEKQGNGQEAIQRLEKLWERYADDTMIGYHLAEILWKNDGKARAAEVFEAIKESNEKHYMANMRLTHWYYEQGQYQQAKDCAEEVLSVGASDEFRELLGKINVELEKDIEKAVWENPSCEKILELGWCYLQDRKYSKGISLVTGMTVEIPVQKLSEYRGLLSKLYAESAQYHKAIEMAELWEDALKEVLAGELEEQERTKNENRWKQSHSIRSYCYRHLGYKDEECFKKAIEHIEIAQNRDKETDFNLMLEKARVYLDMGEFDKCLEVTRILVEDYQVYAAYATSMEAYRKMWNANGIIQDGFNCIHFFPDYARPYERIARVYADLEYKEELEKLLRDAKERKVESIYLDAYEYRSSHEIPGEEEFDKKLEEFHKNYREKVENGELKYYEEGLKLLTEYFYWCPGVYMLVERGLYFNAASEYDKAIEAFEKALSEEPGNPYAWNGLAYSYRMKGDFEQALICTRNAILYYEEEYTRPYANLGDLYSLLGEHEKAYEAYQDVLRVGGEGVHSNQYYMHRYAVILAKTGRLDAAEKVISKAYSNLFERYNELVEIYYSIGALQKAQETAEIYEKELKNRQKTVTSKEMAKFYDCMAWKELVFGDGYRALEYFDKEFQERGGQGDSSGVYCDAIFASILCGDEERGKKYAASLRAFMTKAEEKGQNICYEMDKIALEREFLMKYYTASDAELEEILLREEKTNICYFCTHCFCKEMEGMRILYLLRTGREKEALERARDILEKQPLDEWMRAVLNICKDGVKVVPYSMKGTETLMKSEEFKQPPQEKQPQEQKKAPWAKMKKMLSEIFKS